MGRKTLTIDEDLFDDLSEAKSEDESWTDFLRNLADGDLNSVNTVVVENVDEIARAAGDEVENRMTRR